MTTKFENNGNFTVEEAGLLRDKINNLADKSKIGTLVDAEFKKLFEGSGELRKSFWEFLNGKKDDLSALVDAKWLSLPKGITKDSPNYGVYVLQAALNKLGAGLGTPDGKFGAGTWIAVTRFQLTNSNYSGEKDGLLSDELLTAIDASIPDVGSTVELKKGDGFSRKEMDQFVNYINKGNDVNDLQIWEEEFKEIVAANSVALWVLGSKFAGLAKQLNLTFPKDFKGNKNVAVLQVMLKHLGVYDGEMTGVMDQSTFKAILKYQAGSNTYKDQKLVDKKWNVIEKSAGGRPDWVANGRTFEAMKKDLVARRAELQSDVDEARQQVADLTSQFDTAKTDYETATDAYTEAMGDQTTLADDVIAAQADQRANEPALLTDKTAKEWAVTAAEADVTTIEGEEATKKWEITTIEGNITTETGKKATAEWEIARLEGEKTAKEWEKTTIESEIATRDADIAKIDTELTAKAAAKAAATDPAQIASIDAEIAALTGQKATFEGEKTQLEADKTRVEGEITALEASIATETTNRDTADTEITRLNNEKTTKTTELADIQSRLSTARDAVTTAQGELQTVVDAIQALQDKVDAAQTALDDKKSQASGLKDQRTDAKTKYDDLKAQLDAAKSNLATLEGQLNTLPAIA